ncbi:MAG: A24 family peptidase [Heliobacteriaceae bacterium]|nr:A24 family peptidase [Heliobacteriaceae bacterium]MDD4588303.1 A24 family peptidase [Heliobacteriaceae bacterium]
MGLLPVLDVLTAALVLGSVVTDLRWQKIPNVLLAPVFVAGMGLQGFLNGGTGLIQAAAGCALGLALLIIPFAVGGIGAGDVKLLAVIGLCQGPEFVFHTFLAGAAAGGVMALGVLYRQRRLAAALGRIKSHFWLALVNRSVVEAMQQPGGGNELPRLPYAVAIAFGVAGAFLVR